MRISFVFVPALLMTVLNAAAAPCRPLMRPSLGPPLETMVSVPRFECGSSAIGGNIQVSTEVANTSVVNRRYAFDAELFQTAISTSFGLDNDIDVVFSLPFRSRSTGELDSSIKSWHDAFNLPDGDTDRFDQDSYKVRGKRDDGTRFDVSKHSFTLANVMAGISGKFVDSDPSRWVLATSLPTSSNDSGHDGVNTHFDAFRNFEYGRWSFSALTGGSVIGDTETANVKFERFIWRVAPGVHYQVADPLRFEVLFQYESTAVAELLGYPGTVLSSDFRAAVRMGELGSILLSLREDLVGPDAQADLVFGLNWIGSF